MNQILTQLSVLAEPFNIIRHPTELLDIILVAGLFYGIYSLINQTRAVRILYGIFILAIIGILGRSFELTLLNSVMRWMLTSIAVAIPVVFQPELRQALEKVGRSTNFVTDLRNFSRKELDQFIVELVTAVKYLLKHRYGALVVISRGSGLREYIESGQLLNATVSAKLIQTLFNPKSPLHDGAIIIEGNQIAA
ncbi:DNA integrity scanning protein DisA nucleotide-binding domain protein, partial [Candidatus Berkelbacteria bacterium]|nr:DNA integrity scanning protein DisA nucleotide-binding domain protein [Candidatus Berkelbacteria bacterium]